MDPSFHNDGTVQVPLDDNTPGNPQSPQDPQPVETPSLRKDFVEKPLEEFKKVSLKLKIHAGIGFGVTSLCFLIWHYVSYNPSLVLWWWIFPMFFFGISVALHHNIAQGTPFNGILASIIQVDILLYLTYKTTNSMFPWYLFPWLASAMVLIPLYYKFNTPPEEFTAYKVIVTEYYLVSLTVFLIWANVELSHPWFIYPIIVLGIPLLVYRVRDHYKETRVYIMTGIPVALLNIMFFLSWGFSSVGWPWFAIPMAMLIAFQSLIMFKYRKQSTHTPIAGETINDEEQGVPVQPNLLEGTGLLVNQHMYPVLPGQVVIPIVNTPQPNYL